MGKTSIAIQVQEIAEPIAAELGLELLEVKFLKEGSHYYLRLVIDKRGGVGIDDCESLSRKVDPLIDTLEIPHAYYLEVQSPGLDRPLKTQADFLRYRGEEVELSFYKAKDGQKKITGVLENNSETALFLKIQDETQEFALEEIAKVKRCIHF